MDILTGYKSTVKFPVPTDLSAAQATITKDGTQYGSPVAAVIENGVASVSIPYTVVATPGDIVVSLTFSYESSQQTISKSLTIVSPYVDLWELKDILGDVSDDEAWAVEKAARVIINNFCGQKFTWSHKTVSMFGNSSGTLELPERLDSLESITIYGTSVYDISQPSGLTFLGDGLYLLDGDGWFLRYGYQFYDVNIIATTNPISDPFWTCEPFDSGTTYSITGVWGYTEVPDNVREAAKLLVNDYSCGDSLYRDRYLQAASTPDWNIEFNSAAFDSTGNVRADQLLNAYKRLGWIVI